MRTMWMAVVVAALVATPGAALAGDKADKPDKAQGGGGGQARSQVVKFAVVNVNEHEIFRLADSGGRTAQARAAEIDQRLRQTLEPNPGERWRSVKPSDVTVETVDNAPVIRLRNQNVIAVTAQDAQLNRRKLHDLAQRWATDLREALAVVRLAQGNKLPAGFVSVASGQLDYGTPGGGAGGAPPAEAPKDKDKDKDKE